MEVCTIHLRDVFVRVLLKTDFGEELGKPSHSVERDRRAMNSTVGSLADSVKTHLSFKDKLEKGMDRAT